MRKGDRKNSCGGCCDVDDEDDECLSLFSHDEAAEEPRQ